MRRTVILFTAACLGLAGCSSSGNSKKPAPAARVTVSASPSLSEAEARQSCVDAWGRWLDGQPDDYDPDTDPAPALPACEGRSDSATLSFEALRERNAANRERLDACLADPACTEFPLP